MWACIRYIKKCAGHSNKESYIVPLSNIEIEDDSFDKNEVYLAKCSSGDNGKCPALISFTQGGKYYFLVFLHKNSM